MRIGELAERAGVSVRALRYYEEQGLLAPERTPAGQRRYVEGDIERVRFVQLLYAAGLTSRGAHALMPCFDTGGTDDEQRSMLVRELGRIRAQIAELREVETRLEHLVEVAHVGPAVGAAAAAPGTAA
ncbi:MerR family transcriptional regulator [Homoserinibacter sp. YIM 151385]|uniref:MerR family transcriptional regulator n=1 Tax=Homoserinibacter sp. YIM 151385 TaxID=2985506 RepID=UPI0022F096A3|nr:MerR family transcriptional regulator [Homoserinibacter sp. YIM 151385]WBU36815.1 MerR family transcriptional regulator [Homoserinibacter sp. YIM 151385]